MSNRLHRIFALLLVLATVGACTVVVEQPRPVPVRPGPPRPLACTLDYAPVCARRGGQQRTFSNACNARASGFQVLYRGQCRLQQPISTRPVACTREFRPVCAVRGNRARTFDNACMARASGFRPIRQGVCR